MRTVDSPYFRPLTTRSVLGLAALGLLLAGDVAARMSVSGESTVDLPASAAAAARAGVVMVFGEGSFDALDQPAAIAAATAARIDAAWAPDRYPSDGGLPWAFGVVVPVGDLGSNLPRIAISHRRTRAEDQVVFERLPRLSLDTDHDLTTVGVGQSFFGGRLRLGTALHAVSKSGPETWTFSNALVDSSWVTPGYDDVLFAGSVGAIVRMRAREWVGGALELGFGVAWRRVGEEIDLTPVEFGSDAGTKVEFVPRPAMGEATAVGLGLSWARGPVALDLAGDLTFPRDGETRIAAALETRFRDVLALRCGVRDDEVGTDLTFGAGLRSPAWGAIRATLDVAYEPTRYPELDASDAFVVGIGLIVDLDGPGDDDLDDVFDDLDAIDDWLEEPEGPAAPSPDESENRP